MLHMHVRGRKRTTIKGKTHGKSLFLPQDTEEETSKRENYMYTVTLLSALTDLDAAFRATPTTQYYDFATPVTHPTCYRRRTVSRLHHCHQLGPVACRVLMCIRCHPSRAVPLQILEFSVPFCLRETRHYFKQCDLFHSFQAVVEVQFGGLARLDRAANNYKDNLNSLYRHPDLTLTIDKVLCNIIVSAYLHYIDSWPMNGACVGHRTILMRSMLQFAMHYGRYRHRQ